MSGDGIELTYVGRPEPEPYIMGPRDMIEQNPDLPLSILARFVLFYLYDLAKRPGWKIYVAHVQRVLDITPGVWVRGRRELEAAGLYRAERQRDPSTGKWVWRHFVYRDPITPLPPLKKSVPAKVAPPSDESIPSKSMDGPSINGCEGDIRSNTQHMPTKRSSRKYARAPALHAAANEQPPSRSPKKTWRERPSGIVCWYSEDHDLAQQIEATIPPNEVSAAVAAIRATGRPSAVGGGVHWTWFLTPHAERREANYLTALAQSAAAGRQPQRLSQFTGTLLNRPLHSGVRQRFSRVFASPAPLTVTSSTHRTFPPRRGAPMRCAQH